MLDGQRSFDLVVRLDEPYRENLEAVRRLSIELPDGGTTTLDSVARIYNSAGPNVIKREQARKREWYRLNAERERERRRDYYRRNRQHENERMRRYRERKKEERDGLGE